MFSLLASFKFSSHLPQLDNFLQHGVHRLWLLALSASTRRSYSTGLKVFQQFLNFCHIQHPIHRCCHELYLQKFISYCFYVLHLRTSSIRGYLSAIRYYCLSLGLSDPLRHSNGQLRFSLFTLLRATEKFQKKPLLPRLPIDITLLSQLCHLLTGYYFDSYWDCLLKAVFSVAFFGFLRIGEFTADRFSRLRHLCLDDLTLESNSATLLLKHSKADRLNKGVVIRYFRTHNRVCPIRTLRSYISARSKLFSTANPRQTPLFIMPNGKALSRSETVKRLRILLSNIGVDASRYSGHSFRIGAASTAAKARIPIYLIKLLGRWSSSAYRRYINVSSATIETAISAMASSLSP